jgi:hypothetical protein
MYWKVLVRRVIPVAREGKVQQSALRIKGEGESHCLPADRGHD